MKNLKSTKSGFTLLEVIIVIIIVGVLASLALPRLFQTVDFSRSNEALNVFREIKSGMQRCAMMRNDDYAACDTWNEIGMEDPGAEPGANFLYTFTATATDSYTVTAALNGTAFGGDERIQLRYNDGDSGGAIENCVDGDNDGNYASIQQGTCNGDI